MALQRNLIQIPLYQGMDTKTDEHLLQVGRLHRAKNVHFDKFGSIRKRWGQKRYGSQAYSFANGYQSSSTASINIPYRLLKNQDSALFAGSITQANVANNRSLLDSLCLYDRNQNQSIEFRDVASNIITSRTFNQPTYPNTPTSWYDLATSSSTGNHLFISRNSGSSANFVAWDTREEKLTFNNNDASEAGDRIIFFNSAYYRIYSKVAGSLFALKFPASQFPQVSGSDSYLANDVFIGAQLLDVYTTSSLVYIIYKEVGGQVKISSYSTLDGGTFGTPVAPTNTITIAETPIETVSITVNTTSDRVYAMWNTAAPATRLWIGNGTLGVVTAAATLTANKSNFITGEAFNTAYTMIAFDAGSTTQFTWNIYDATGLVSGKLVSGAAMASKPKSYGSVLYQWVQRISAGQNALQLIAYGVRVTTAISFEYCLAGQVLNGTLYTPPNYNLPQIAKYSNYLYCCFNKLVDDLGSTEIVVPCIVKVDVGDPNISTGYDNKYIFTELSESTFISAGSLLRFDGSTCQNAQSYGAPEIVSLTPSVGAGALTAVAAYSFIVVYEFVDAKGRTWYSAPSAPKSVTLAGAQNTITQVIQSFLGALGTPRTYRTLGNGTVYYYDPTSGSASDATISSNQTLYTESGELPNSCPPPVSAITTWQERLWALTDDGVRYSKKATDLVPPQFADELFMDIESVGGVATAIAPLGDKLLVFKKGRVYYTTGEGPNEQGAYGTFSPFRLLSSSFGCLYQDSVLALGNEVWFLSEEGYLTIDSSFQIRKNTEIDEYMKGPAVPRVLSAQHFEDLHEIRIQEYNRTYIYDTQAKIWAFSDWAFKHNLMVGSRYHSIDNAYIYYDDYTAFGDNNNNSIITSSITTGWIIPNVQQGLERFYKLIVLARLINDTPLKIDVFYDYNPQIAYSFTFNPTGKGMIKFSNANIYLNDSFSSSDTLPFQWVLQLPRQKCEAIRFTISDVPGSVQDTFELVALGLEVGMKQNIYKVKDAVKG